jgi:AcrR family transcriptional regulator
MAGGAAPELGPDDDADWQRRVVGRSLDAARRRSIDRGARFVRAAAKVLERNGASLTVQQVADEAGQSLRTLYQYFESKDDLLLAVFEEAMRVYARILRAAIEPFDDPVERIAAAVIASARVLALHDKASFDRALSQLRLQLGQVDAALIARSQAPVTALYAELIGALPPDAPIAVHGDAAVYFVMSLRDAFTMSTTLGNSVAGDLPDAVDLSCFCLNGLGLVRPRSWHQRIDKKLQLGSERGPSVLKTLAKAAPRR